MKKRQCFKKAFTLGLIAMLGLTSLTGCGKKNEKSDTATNTDVSNGSENGWEPYYNDVSDEEMAELIKSVDDKQLKDFGLKFHYKDDIIDTDFDIPFDVNTFLNAGWTLSDVDSEYCSNNELKKGDLKINLSSLGVHEETIDTRDVRGTKRILENNGAYELEITGFNDKYVFSINGVDITNETNIKDVLLVLSKSEFLSENTYDETNAIPLDVVLHGDDKYLKNICSCFLYQGDVLSYEIKVSSDTNGKVSTIYICAYKHYEDSVEDDVDKQYNDEKSTESIDIKPSYEINHETAIEFDENGNEVIVDENYEVNELN